MQNRENIRLAVKVRTGILIDAVNGASAAWAYMMHYQVPRHVILRVLAAPARRRTSDARHPLSEQETRRLGNLAQLQRRYLSGPDQPADTDNGGKHHGVDLSTANFFPLPTLRTKNTVRLLQPGMRLKIDAVNIENPYDCIEVDTWLVVKADGLHFRYQDGPGGRQVDLGNADAVRAAIDAAPAAD
ncbi:hypothetical protein SAMN05216319_1350 [Duganella sp. CF402]|uniref:hypothetical protein n=1 Tax=unclassified Duganella TaxID=2636909 RepID=UPI0008D6BFEC|nr:MULTISPECIES: hypothetical protein [unclassified Duganella]RZT10197.1 hypothetical protein EV582_2275 [Duganella sp. BK701]SEL23807.1 hypothetical protein SAMN05216319_1350 [Duganella sp. CF402]